MMRVAFSDPVFSYIKKYKQAFSAPIGAKKKGGERVTKKTETIKTVNARYGYKPEHSLFREQVGAVFLVPNIGRGQHSSVA